MENQVIRHLSFYREKNKKIVEKLALLLLEASFLPFRNGDFGVM